MSAFDRLPARLLALALTLCISLGLARHFTGARVAQMEARTVDSLTAALLEAGAQKALAGAEREALAQLAAAGKTVPTADLSPEDPAAPLPGATRLECPGGIPWDSIGEQTSTVPRKPWCRCWSGRPWWPGTPTGTGSPIWLWR